MATCVLPASIDLPKCSLTDSLSFPDCSSSADTGSSGRRKCFSVASLELGRTSCVNLATRIFPIDIYIIKKKNAL